MPTLPIVIGEDTPYRPSSSVATYDPNIVANAMEKAGTQLGNDAIIAARQQKLAAIQDTVQKKNAADKETLNLLYGDGTPQNPGVYGLKGVNARGADTRFEEAFKGIQERALTGVVDPYARRSLENDLNTMETTHLGSIKMHMQQQGTAYTGDLMQARSAGANEAVVTAPQDESLFQKSLADKQEAVTQIAKIKGFQTPVMDNKGNIIQAGDDGYQQMIMAANGELVHNRIATLLDNPDPAVQAQALTLWKKISGEASPLPTNAKEAGSEEQAAANVAINAARAKGATSGTVTLPADDKNPAFTKSYSNPHHIVMDTKSIMDTDRLIKAAEPRLSAMSSFHDFVNSNSVGTSESSPEDIIRFVQNDPRLEGGGKTAIDNNGGKVQYGLNSKANPDLAIGTLTSDQAVAAAKERYWDKYKIGDLPKNMQAIAFDTVYNMGGSGELLIKESAGDPARLLQLRENRYRELAQRPENAGLLGAWLSRNAALGGRVGDGPINPQDAANFQKQLPVAEQEPFGKLVEEFNGKLAAQKDQATKQTMDTALDFIMKNGKGYDYMPISLQDSIDRLGMTQQIKDYSQRSTSDESALANLNQMDGKTLAGTDLNVPGVRLNLSMQDYSRFKQKQTALGNNPQALATRDQMNAMVKKGFFARGLSLQEKRDPNDPERVTFDGAEQFNRAQGILDDQISAYVDQHKAYPATPELQKMVDGIFTKVITAPHWYGDSTANKYDNIKLADIPVEARAQILQTLEKNGRTPTPEIIKYMWLNSLPEAPKDE